MSLNLKMPCWRKNKTKLSSTNNHCKVYTELKMLVRLAGRYLNGAEC